MGLHSRGGSGPVPDPDSDPSMRNANSMASANPGNSGTNPSVRFLSLLRLALPSILLQSGAPLAITFQTALIGRKATELVAAWAIVATATNAATVVFNFLVVGVTAKVTKVVAVGAWAQVGSRIRLALGMALVMGMTACALLLGLQRPLWLLLDSSSPLVLSVAEAYFYLRVAGVPPQLFVMCTSGILQGYKRVNLVAILQGLRVILDVIASYVSLYILDWGLVGVGIGTILASSLVATAALACILLLPPEEGKHKIKVLSPLLPAWAPAWMGGEGFTRQSSHEIGDLESAHERLLPGPEGGGTERGEEGPEGGEGTQGGVGSLVVSVRTEGEGGREGTGEGKDGAEGGRGMGKGGGRWRGAGGSEGERKGEREERGEEEEEAEEEERVNAVLNESTWKFVWDGLSTMLRSALVQATFFLVLACATVLGMHAVAAHQVLMQLWMINIYIADGFATAGTIVCSSLAGHMAQATSVREKRRHLQDLRLASWRVLYLGTGAGVTLACVYFFWAEELMSIFTHDPATKEQLRRVWPFLVAIQPLNSIVFVYDGLIYAAQAFSYMAACLTFGFLLLFLPCIALSYFYFKTLLSAWMAKGVLNGVRFFVAGYKIHFHFLCPQLKDELEGIATEGEEGEEAGPEGGEETETSSNGGELEGNLMGSSVSSESFVSSPHSPREGPLEQTDM